MSITIYHDCASPKVKKFFARNLAALMWGHGYTQELLAEELGLSQAAISNYLRGRVPRANTLFAIANHFRVSAPDLLHKDLASAFAQKSKEAGVSIKDSPRPAFRRRTSYDKLMERFEALDDEEAERVARVFLGMLDVLKEESGGQPKSRGRRRAFEADSPGQSQELP